MAYRRDNPELEDIGASMPNKPNRHKNRKQRKSNPTRSSKKSRPKSYRGYIKSARWARIRQQALEHYGGRCTQCCSQHDLCVSHLNWERIGTEKMSDLTVLCRVCHNKKFNGDSDTDDPISHEYREIVIPNSAG